MNIQSFEIKYVCNLLVPKEISKTEFDKNTILMDDQRLIVECDGSLEEVEKSLESILHENNFYLLKQTLDSQGEGEDFLKMEGYAEGKYDKKDVALSVIMQKMEEHTQLIIKAMSDEKAKLTDILKDISNQCDDIKSDNELIKEYSSQIENIFDKLDDVESFLKKNLASDFEKIKYVWEDYKLGKINRKQFIKEGIKLIGKKFIKILLKTL